MYVSNGDQNGDQNKKEEFDNSNLVQQNMDLSTRNNEQSCISQNNAIIVENHGNYGNHEITNENSANCDGGTSQNDTLTTASATPPIHKCHKKYSSNCQKQLGEPYLQNKISKEDLLYKNAARKFAELELQRKVLEIERLKWELQRDKYQSEIRWRSDVRLMQYQEEKAKRLTEN
ncbi:hypothetical protein WN51_05264 [Melipona quadrifasciata]|uniref:Uncharacterized protein n=1 Tax=Melipona quadrifasciata TaxID=166423 RepID=A0A0M8ZTL0_9HYME|nr:hypothetical protein WN51_05264 [Melipona quadrifasciata]